MSLPARDLRKVYYTIDSGCRNEVTCIDRDPRWYIRKVKEAIHIRRHSGIEIPQTWMHTIKKHNCRSIAQQSAGGITFSRTADGTTS